MTAEDARAKALGDYRKRLLEHRQVEARLKECTLCSVSCHIEAKTRHQYQTHTHKCKVRLGLRTFEKDFDKTENDIKALQSVGQIIGEVLKPLDSERCMFTLIPCVEGIVYRSVCPCGHK